MPSVRSLKPNAIIKGYNYIDYFKETIVTASSAPSDVAAFSISKHLSIVFSELAFKKLSVGSSRL